MKSLIKTFTALLLAAAVLCTFAACDSNISEDSGSTESNVSETSESTGEKRSELLLYKVNNLPGTEYAYTVTYDYTEFGEISSQTSVMSWDTTVTKYEYNDSKQLISKTTTDSNGKVTEKYEFEYNDLGLLVKDKLVSDHSNREILYSYDENNRVISINILGGKQSTYTYNEDGSYEIGWIDLLGNAILEVYDQKGLITGYSSSDGHRSVWSYNEKGDILTVENYNALGELSTKETYEYNGQITVYRVYEYDELEYTEKKYYDDQNNLIKTIYVDEWGNESVSEEREYKLFDVIG